MTEKRLMPSTGTGARTGRLYTDEERAVIRAVYPTGGPEGCIAAGVDRSKASVICEAKRMRVRLDPGARSARLSAAFSGRVRSIKPGDSAYVAPKKRYSSVFAYAMGVSV